MDSNEKPKLDPLIPVTEAARMLGTTRGNAWKWARKGILPPPIRLTSRKVGWRKSTLEALLQQREQAVV